MKKSLAMGLATAMTMAAGTAAHAATFASAPIAPEQGLGGLTRAVAREFTGRAVFAQPWATVTLSHLDLYDRVPYVESRQFQIVSDPTWNRLVAGEIGHGLVAYDGAGDASLSGAGGAGPRRLKSPHGLAVDERDRVYVADTGNDRILVLQAHTEFEQITFTPLYAIDGLSAPYDVAYSDGGTPFDAGDDAIVVANTGRNEIVAYALEGNGARRTAALGALGSGDGEFAGPTAVAFGREAGANTGTVYVADAHNRRIAQVTLRGGALRWSGAAEAGADVVTSLDTDHWGNVYAAAPQQGLVRKFNRALQPVAELRGAVARPRSFRIPFTTVRDHRDGSVTRRGQASALSLDTWADDRGLALWNLGVSVEQLAITGGAAPSAQFVLTDPADVAIEVTNTATGQVVGRRTLGTL
ncbi:MAG: NHL repeat-containing protein, partial [Candidatus Eisenbacteria bacterium]|nr:NHL repeat-containing protein [Candidatus Eisenbacteria bacterium]